MHTGSERGGGLYGRLRMDESGTLSTVRHADDCGMKLSAAQ